MKGKQAVQARPGAPVRARPTMRRRVFRLITWPLRYVWSWLSATVRYVKETHDPMLYRLIGSTLAALFGLDVTAMIVELLDDLFGFLPDDWLIVPEAPSAAVLALLAFKWLGMRSKIKPYRK